MIIIIIKTSFPNQGSTLLTSYIPNSNSCFSLKYPTGWINTDEFNNFGD